MQEADSQQRPSAAEASIAGAGTAGSAGQSAVSATVWPWRAGASESLPAATPASRRKRAAVCESAAAFAVGLLLRYVFGHPRIAAVVFAIAALVLVGGLCVPPLYRGFKRVGHYLAVGVGVGLTWLLLVPFFYICFPLGRLVLLLKRKDPLQRAFPTPRTTYWTPYRKLPGADPYTRQY